MIKNLMKCSLYHIYKEPLSIINIQGSRVVSAFDCSARGRGFDPSQGHVFRDIISDLNFPCADMDIQ